MVVVKAYSIANLASLSVKVQSWLLARYLDEELMKMTQDPTKSGPGVPLPDDGPLTELVAELVHASVLNGHAGREAARNLALVNRVLIVHHEAEVVRLNAMNEMLGREGH